MVFTGKSVSQGVAVGRIFVYKPFTPVVSESHFGGEEAGAKLEQYRAVRKKAAAELERIRNAMKRNNPDKAEIFTAHLDILFDEELDEMVSAAILKELLEPDFAIEKIYSQSAERLAQVEDSLIQERAADINDVKLRLLRNWAGVAEKNLSVLTGPVIVATRDLTPSDTATMDVANVMGIVTEKGGATSHTAILARSYGIPAVLGVSGFMDHIRDGGEAVLDAYEGKLITDPDDEQKRHYRQKEEQDLREARQLQLYLNRETRTRDDEKIEIGLNIGSCGKKELAAAEYMDYVGLFRTEFLYMNSESLPDEEHQFKIYKKVLEAYQGRPVTLRTLDIGGDKNLPYLELPREDNPFLGCRALRFCFREEELFQTQLRAALRASVYGNLWIMLPMVASLDDVRRAKSIIQDVKQRLSAENIAYSENIKVGVMIEIPSVALIADALAKEVDFASIGTNDLCQYLTASDRLNESVSEYYQSYHPALFRLIGSVVSEFNRAGKPISVCGEMGGDRLSAPVLVGLGMRKLSMSLSSAAKIKKVLSELTTGEMKEMAERVVRFATAGEVQDYLNGFLKSIETE